LAKKKQITLTTHKTDCVATADETSITKLLTILLDNAIKYTPEKGRVTLTSEHSDKALQLTVSDTGVGIARQEQPHIFDRFYRADLARTKDKSSGFGLGLAIAKRIVQLHKGKISVESKLGHGSTFTVTLPLNA